VKFYVSALVGVIIEVIPSLNLSEGQDNRRPHSSNSTSECKSESLPLEPPGLLPQMYYDNVQGDPVFVVAYVYPYSLCGFSYLAVW